MEKIRKTVLDLLFGLVLALILGLPVMFLTDFLHGQGWPCTPLGYWASVLVAFLVGWIIDGSSAARRALADRAA